MQRINLDLYFTPYIKNNSKWIIYQSQTIKFLVENIKVFMTLDFSIKEEIDKLDPIKIKIFCSVKDTAKRIIRNFRLETNVCKLDNKKTNNYF